MHTVQGAVIIRGAGGDHSPSGPTTILLASHNHPATNLVVWDTSERANYSHMTVLCLSKVFSNPFVKIFTAQYVLLGWGANLF